jgi:hypothetical protein
MGYPGGVGVFGALLPGPTGPGNVTYDNANAPITPGVTVQDGAVAPQITPGTTPYQQPNTSAPALDAQVDSSTALAQPGPPQIEAGAAFIQANPNPADSIEIDASTASAGSGGSNPMGVGGGWSGNYQQPM